MCVLPRSKYHGPSSTLDSGDLLLDGFYDPGRSGELLPLPELAKEPVGRVQREVILVDARTDPLLARRAAAAVRAMQAQPGGALAKARALALFVSDTFGGRPLASELEEEIVQRLECQAPLRGRAHEEVGRRLMQVRASAACGEP